MARTKKANKGGVASSPSPSRDSGHSSPDRPTGPLSIIIAPEDRDTVKVNNANLTELKNACDDAVKRVSAPTVWDKFKRVANFCSGVVLVQTGFVQADIPTYRCTISIGVGERLCRCWHSVVRI
jgi:hypothetical protein